MGRKITDIYSVLFNVSDKQYKKGLKSVEKETEKTTSRISQLTKKLGGIKTAALAAAAGFAALVKSSISAYREQEKAERRLEAAARASSKMSVEAAEDIKRWAAELQTTTTVGDEVSLAVANVGIAVGNLGKNQIKPFMQLTADLAAATGRSVSRVSRTLAASLADPIRGLSTLRTQGLQVDEAFERQIKSLVRLGKVSEAQTLIMARFQEGVKGQAASLRSGAGAFDVLRNSLGDMMEAIGKLATKVLAPLALQLNKVVKSVTRLIEMIPGARDRDESLQGKGWLERLGARDERLSKTRKGRYVTRTTAWGVRKIWVPEEEADAAEDAEATAAAEAAELETDRENEMVSKEIARFEASRARRTKYAAIEKKIEDAKIKALNASTAGHHKLAAELRRQELALEKDLNKQKLADQKKTDRERIRATMKTMDIVFRGNRKYARAMAAVRKAELVRELAMRVRADASRAFGATTAKGGFWSIALAWTAFATTAATLTAALANIKNYHQGGMVTRPDMGDVPGLRTDETLAKLQVGELVIPRDQVDAFRGGGTVQVELVGDAGKLLQVVRENREFEGL